MRHVQPVSSIESLRPDTPVDRVALYSLIRDELSARFAHRHEAVQRLALASVRHLSGDGVRVLLRGEADTPSVEMSRTLAGLVGLPYVEIDAGALAETNWAGADLAFYIRRLYDDLRTHHSYASAPSIAERACILVTHLDRTRLAGEYASASTRDYREGQQKSLVPLYTGGAIPVSEGRDGGFVWHSRKALVITSAGFDGVTARRPDASDLASWGLLEALAVSLATATIINLDPPTAPEVEAAVWREVERVAAQFAWFGYRLRVTEEAVTYAVRSVTVGPYEGGAAAAASCIAEAADRALVRMLEEGATPGSRWVVARDDITLPDRPVGFWRE